MQRLEANCAVRPLYGSLGVKGLNEYNKMALPKFKLHLCVYRETVWHSESKEPLHEVIVLRHGVRHFYSCYFY